MRAAFCQCYETNAAAFCLLVFSAATNYCSIWRILLSASSDLCDTASSFCSKAASACSVADCAMFAAAKSCCARMIPAAASAVLWFISAFSIMIALGRAFNATFVFSLHDKTEPAATARISASDFICIKLSISFRPVLRAESFSSIVDEADANAAWDTDSASFTDTISCYS
jgi:hypothetical protein